MARGEGDSALKSNFVERVVKLPMVHVVWDYASNTYSHIKESNKLVNFTLTNAEKTANFVAGQAKPVVLKFEKQIQAVDELACKGLGTLEEKVPFIKKPADEIIGETRKLYVDSMNSRLNGIVQYGNQTVRSAADFGIKQATSIFGERMVQTALARVDGLLIVSQKYVDHYLTPLEGEKTMNGPKKNHDGKKPSTLTRVVHIADTIRRRTYRTLVVQIENIQEKTLDLLLTFPIQMIELSKTNLDFLYEYASKFWLAIRQGEVDETDAAERTQVEQQLLHLARMVSRQVASAYSSFSPSTPESQEPSQTPAAITVARDGAMWVMGMVKLIPQLLPMYIYGLVLWLEKKPSKETESDEKEQETVKQNGSVPKHAEHEHSNNVQDNHVEHNNVH